MTITCGEFQQALARFSPRYRQDFKSFWLWKLRIESRGQSVLDEGHRAEAYWRLSSILASWQAYRPFGQIAWRKTLQESLGRIADAYDRIRHYTLLEFDKVPDDQLKLIWHELGRVKARDGRKDGRGHYYVIAVCKPLMLLWGQTLAFDGNVRSGLSDRYPISATDRHCAYEHWRHVMGLIQRDLHGAPELVAWMRGWASCEYGSDAIVPYGRLLDMYYWAVSRRPRPRARF